MNQKLTREPERRENNENNFIESASCSPDQLPVDGPVLWPRPPTYSARWTSQPPSCESLVQAAVTSYLVCWAAKAAVDMWEIGLWTLSQPYPPTPWIVSCSSDWPNSPNRLRAVNEPTAQVVNHLFRPQHHAARSAVRLNKIWRDVTSEPHTSSKWTRLSLGEIGRLPRSAERGKDLRNADFFQWWKILE